MKLFTLIIFLNYILLNEINNYYELLTENNLTIYQKKLHNRFQIEFKNYLSLNRKLEKLMLEWKKSTLNSFDDFFKLIYKDDELLTFFYNEQIKNYVNILEQEKNNWKHIDEKYHILKIDHKFFNNEKNFKEDEYFYSPYWLNDESFEKFKEYFEEILFKNNSDDNYFNLLNDFNYNISFKKLIKKEDQKQLELFYNNKEIYEHPIIFNYYFLPKIKLEKELNELTFYTRFKNSKIDKSKIFERKGNKISFSNVNKNFGTNIFLDNIILFNNNLINTLNEFIILNFEKNLNENEFLIFNINENNIFFNEIVEKDENLYFDSIPPIFKISLNENWIVSQIKINDCDKYDSCYFTQLFEKNGNADLGLYTKYFSIYFLFYEAKIFGFKDFSNDLKKIINYFIEEKFEFENKDSDLKKIISKIIFEFDLENFELLKYKIKYYISPILNYFSKKVFESNTSSLKDYFENSEVVNKPSFNTVFLEDDKLNTDNFKNEYLKHHTDIIYKDFEINYFILFNIVYKFYIKSFNKEKGSFKKSLRYFLKDKKNQFKLLANDIIKLFSFKTTLKEKMKLILANVSFISQFFLIFYNIYNLANAVIQNSIYGILKNTEYIWIDIRNFFNKIKISKLIFLNFENYTKDLFFILNNKNLNPKYNYNYFHNDKTPMTNFDNSKSNVNISFRPVIRTSKFKIFRNLLKNNNKKVNNNKMMN